jgi:predicted phosphodiesterase
VAVNLPIRLSLSVRGKTITIVHDIADLDWSSRSCSHVVVTGHSHKPGYRMEDETLFFNPGSAGPRRFKLPISVGELTVAVGRISPKLVTIATSERLQRGGAARSQG